MILTRFARYLAEAPKPWVSTRTLPPNQGEIGEEARKLLDNPVLIEALNRIERKLIDAWQTSRAGDAEQREASYRLYWAVESLKAELRVMIANAGMAARRE